MLEPEPWAHGSFVGFGLQWTRCLVHPPSVESLPVRLARLCRILSDHTTVARHVALHLMDQMGSGAGAGGIIIGVLVRPDVVGAVGVDIVVLRRYSTVSIQI